MAVSRAKEFGRRLKQLRIQKGFNMQYVSDCIGVARSTYAGYETQERFAPVETLAKIAEVLGTSTDYLIGITNNPEPKDLTRDINEYLSSVGDLNWKGVPLTNEDLKPLCDLFQIVLRDRIFKTEYEEANKGNGAFLNHFD